MENSNKVDSYFNCNRVNATTFVIHEKDKYEEHPFIYVKTFENVPVLVLSDTGCGGGKAKQLHATNLKDFIETSPISSNHGSPLNPRHSTGKATKKYLIICTHCHYDHILGLSHFQDDSPDIIASWNGKAFIESDLPEHSLCKYLEIPVPKYKVTTWAHDYQKLYFDDISLHLQVIHTPGHTPDEIAWYDDRERHLYVGDTLYERVAKDKSYEQAILFPKEGNIVDYLSSLNKLLLFVETKNNDDSANKGPVKIGCGHVTSSVDGKEILLAVRQLFLDIVQGKVPIVGTEEKRGEVYATWKEDGEPRFSVTAPKRIMQDAKQNWGKWEEYIDANGERARYQV